MFGPALASTPAPSAGPGGTVTAIKDGFQAPPWFEVFSKVDWNGRTAHTIYVLLFLGLMLYGYAKNRTTRGFEEMGAGGMSYVVGPMGSGKSMFGVGQIVKALCDGKYVVTNVELLPVGHTQLPEGWASALVRKRFPRDWRNPERRRARIAWLEGYYVYETSLRKAMRYRLPCATCGGDARVCGHLGPAQEARGLFVWDETHNDLNNRDYAGHGNTVQERNDERERRRHVIRFATQLRKLGYAGYLLSQHQENTDKQLQRVCNWIVKLQNQRNAEGFWLAQLLPRRWTVFLHYHFPTNLADPQGSFRGVRATYVGRYVLPWHRCLYDSWATYAGIDDDGGLDDSPVLLPGGGLGGQGALPAPPGGAHRAVVQGNET